MTTSAISGAQPTAMQQAAGLVGSNETTSNGVSQPTGPHHHGHKHHSKSSGASPPPVALQQDPSAKPVQL